MFYGSSLDYGLQHIECICGSPEAISSANMGSSDTRVLSTSRIACLFLSAADDLSTVTEEISVSCTFLSMVAMVPNNAP